MPIELTDELIRLQQAAVEAEVKLAVLNPEGYAEKKRKEAEKAAKAKK
ncbi:hypothetical protein [Streptomyces sp. NPDC058664]